MAGVCSLPVVSDVCSSAGGVVADGATSAVNAIAKSLADGLATVLKTVTTFWTQLDVPTMSAPGGPVVALQHNVFWLQGFIVVASLLYAAGKMAITRDGKAAAQAAGALMLTIVVTGLGLTAIDLASSASDSYSTWIITQSTGGDLGSRLLAISNLSTLSGMAGLMIVFGILGIVAAFAQLGLLIARIGVLVVIGGTLPVTAAGTNTQMGRAWFQRILGWLIAFVVYKPVAATIYAGAFYLIGDGQDITSVMSGLVLLMLSVLALPALLRLITPAVNGAVNGEFGGGLALAAGGVLASGARMIADRSSSKASAAGTAATAGATGARLTSTGSAGAASAASGPAGAAVALGRVAHSAAKSAGEHAASLGQ